MHDEDLRRQVVILNDLRKVLRHIVDIGGVERTDHCPRLRPALHGELRIEREMHIWHFEVGIEQRKLGRKRTEAQLYIEDDDPVYLVGNAECFVDLRIGHAQAILTVLTRASLRGDVDVFDRGHHWGGRIRRVPFCHFRLKLRDHHILRVLTKHSHPLGIKITVVRDDAMERQNGARERIRRFHGPELLLCRSGCGGRGSALYGGSTVVRQLQHFFVICDPVELRQRDYVRTRRSP